MRQGLVLLPFLTLALGQSLSLEALLQAFPKTPGYQALEAQYAQAQAQYAQAQAALGLKVSAGGSLAYTALGQQEAWSRGLSASLSLDPLPYGPAREALRQAQRALERAGLTRQAGAMDLLQSLLNQYWTTYLAEQNLEVAQKALEVAQASYRVAQAKRAQGALAEADLKRAEASLAQAEAGLAQAQAQRDSALAALYAALGEPPGPPPGTPPPDPPEAPPLEEALKALPERPDVRKAQNSLLDAQEALAYAQGARLLPQGSLGLTLGQIGGTNPGSTLGVSLNVGNGQISGTANYVPNASGAQGVRVSLSLAFPLLAPDLDSAVAAAQAALRAAQAGLASTLASAEAEIRARHAAYLSALKGLEAAQKALEAADQALADGEKRLQAGLITPLDLETLRLSRMQAAYALTSAQVNAYLGWLALERALGRLSPETLARR